MLRGRATTGQEFQFFSRNDLGYLDKGGASRLFIFLTSETPVTCPEVQGKTLCPLTRSPTTASSPCTPTKKKIGVVTRASHYSRGESWREAGDNRRQGLVPKKPVPPVQKLTPVSSGLHGSSCASPTSCQAFDALVAQAPPAQSIPIPPNCIHVHAHISSIDGFPLNLRSSGLQVATRLFPASAPH